MATAVSNDSMVHDDDLIEGDTWSNDNTETVTNQKSAAAQRYTPKWRNIEQYWEERRLREQLKDVLRDED